MLPVWEKKFIFWGIIHHFEQICCYSFDFEKAANCPEMEKLIFRQTICTFDLMLKEQVCFRIRNVTQIIIS